MKTFNLILGIVAALTLSFTSLTSCGGAESKAKTLSQKNENHSDKDFEEADFDSKVKRAVKMLNQDFPTDLGPAAVLDSIVYSDAELIVFSHFKVYTSNRFDEVGQMMDECEDPATKTVNQAHKLSMQLVAPEECDKILKRIGYKAFFNIVDKTGKKFGYFCLEYGGVDDDGEPIWKSVKSIFGDKRNE